MSFHIRASEVFWKYFWLVILFMYLSAFVYILLTQDALNRRQIIVNQHLLNEIIAKKDAHMMISESNNKLLVNLSGEYAKYAKDTNAILEELKDQNTMLLQDILYEIKRNGKSK